MALSPITCTCDVFEWLVLMEVLSFEDFEFVSAFAQLAPHVFGATHSFQREFRLAGGKRLFLIHAGGAGNYRRFRATDIACIYSSMPLLPGAASDEVVDCFNAVARQGVRTCLLYTCEDTMPGRSLAERTGAVAHVEWEIPRTDALRPWKNGLILSANWRAGVCRHAASKIANFMQTRAPCGQPSITGRLREEVRAR